MIQDIFPHKLENQYRPEAQPEQDSYVLCYRGAEILLKDGEMLPTVSEVFAEHYRYLFQIDNRSYFLPETPVSENDAMQVLAIAAAAAAFCTTLRNSVPWSAITAIKAFIRRSCRL